MRIDVAAVGRLDDAELAELAFDWPLWARPEQLPPPGDWVTWLMLGGRGSGKTRAGAEWVRGLAADGVGPIALVGETITEAMAVMIHGPSGILAVTPPAERPKLSGATLHWPNGVEAMVLGASDPERFRGPQFAAAWCDEVGKWPKAEAAWDMLQFGLRLGDAAAAIGDDDAAADEAAEAAAGRPADRGDADDDGGEPPAPGGEFSERRGGALPGHAFWGGRSSTAS